MLLQVQVDTHTHTQICTYIWYISDNSKALKQIMCWWISIKENTAPLKMGELYDFEPITPLERKMEAKLGSTFLRTMLSWYFCQGKDIRQTINIRQAYKVVNKFISHQSRLTILIHQDVLAKCNKQLQDHWQKFWYNLDNKLRKTTYDSRIDIQPHWKKLH